jgi:hypothetical protein
MKRFFWLLLLSVLILPPTAVAQTEEELLDFDGFDYEDPDSDPLDFASVVGDGYVLLALVPSTNPSFLVTDHVVNQYTLKFNDLTITTITPFGSFRFVDYTQGNLEVWEDSRTTGTAADYGINPPNGTAPPTFCDGTLILGGDVNGFSIILDLTLGTGSARGDVDFNAGTQLGNIPQDATKVYTFSGLTSGVSSIPEGYVNQVTGAIMIEQPVQVNESTWGRMKALYR